MTDQPCAHAQWAHRACADAHLAMYVCTACRSRFALPLLVPKPRLLHCKFVLRVARAMTKEPGPARYCEVVCRSVDVPYLHGLLDSAGYVAYVPEFATRLLVRAGQEGAP